MSDPQKIHPVAILFTFLRLLKDLIVPLIFGSVALFRNAALGNIWLQLLIVIIVLAVLVLYSWISWYRFSYQVENGELKTVQGVFVRKKRYISSNRIQSIDLSAGPVHRVFGLVRVEVQTAGSNMEAEAGLKAVSREEGERLQAELQSGPNEEERTEESGEQLKQPTGPARRISSPVLFLAATTSGGIGVFLSVFAIAGSQLNQLIPETFFSSAYQWVIGTSVLLLVFLALLGLIALWLMAIAGTFLKYSYFTIVKKREELKISRGLLEKKQLTIPLNRIQAIRVQENLLRQPLGYATVYAEVAGGSADKDEDFSTVLFPMMKKNEITEFLAEYVPDYQFEPTWKTLPVRAARRFIYRAVFLPLLFVLPLLYFFPAFWFGAVIVLLAAAGLGYLRYKDSGFATGTEELAVRLRVFSRETVLAKRKRIQAFTTSEHFFQHRADLKSIQLAVASQGGVGKTFQVKDMEKENANQLINWYSFEYEEGREKENERPAD